MIPVFGSQVSDILSITRERQRLEHSAKRLVDPEDKFPSVQSPCVNTFSFFFFKEATIFERKQISQHGFPYVYIFSMLIEID